MKKNIKLFLDAYEITIFHLCYLVLIDILRYYIGYDTISICDMKEETK